MKITFNKLFILFFVLFVLGASSFVYAQNGNKNNERSTGANADNNFCSKIADLGSKVSQMISEKMGKLDLKRGERDQKLNEKRAEIDQKLGENRQRWDSNRAEQYAKLQEKADTDVKKQALLNFISAVDTAIAGRRAAINTAQNNFRTAIDKLVENRGGTADNVVDAYKAAVQSAITKAIGDCATQGADAKNIREMLMTELKAARGQYVSDKQEIDKLGEQVKTLTDARKVAFEKAKADFKTAVDKAKADLKTAFGELKSTPAPSPAPQP